MPFSVCWYHVVWATHERQPLITRPLESAIYSAIKLKSNELKCDMRAVNGVPDHIHVAVQIPPSLAVSEWVRHVKGASSFAANNVLPETQSRFRWQTSYGVLTVGVRHLPFVVRYIQQQKEHHDTNTDLQPYLERTTE